MTETAQAKKPPPQRKPFRRFQQSYPEIADAYSELSDAVRRAGPLEPREAALIKLGISLGARMEGAAHVHARKAIAAGIDADSLRQVALMTCPTLGFPQMMAGLGWVQDVVGVGENHGKERAQSNAPGEPDAGP